MRPFSTSTFTKSYPLRCVAQTWLPVARLSATTEPLMPMKISSELFICLLSDFFGAVILRCFSLSSRPRLQAKSLAFRYKKDPALYNLQSLLEGMPGIDGALFAHANNIVFETSQ